MEDSGKLSHLDSEGKARMVDIGEKPVQKRMARAVGLITLLPETIRLVQENLLKKGDVLTVAEIAGIMGAKRTSELIPLCHPIALSSVRIVCQPVSEGIRVESEARCDGKTGVEMEALAGVSIALLTIYDMCKAVDKQMVIREVRLIEKTKGGN